MTPSWLPVMDERPQLAMSADIIRFLNEYREISSDPRNNAPPRHQRARHDFRRCDSQLHRPRGWDRMQKAIPEEVCYQSDARSRLRCAGLSWRSGDLLHANDSHRYQFHNG